MIDSEESLWRQCVVTDLRNIRNYSVIRDRVLFILCFLNSIIATVALVKAVL